MSMNPKISIIMPSLNVCEYIDECIESALNQTIKGLELICIDAGSTDGTWEKLEEYAAENTNDDLTIKLIKSDVRSYGYQVNLGISASNGKYIAILETDDYIVPEMYQKLFDIAENTGVDYVKAAFDMFETYPNKEVIFRTSYLWPKSSPNYNCVIDPHKNDELYGRDYCLWTGIYRASFLKRNNIRLNETPGAAFQDIGFTEQMLAYSRKAYYTDESYYRYRTDRLGSSINSKNGLKFSQGEFENILDNQYFWDKVAYQRGTYSYMLGSFYGEFHKLIRIADYSWQVEYIEPYVNWFLEKLSKAIRDGILVENQYTRGLFPFFYGIKKNPTQYCRNLSIADEKIETNRNKIASLSKKGRIYIMGAGVRGVEAVRILLSKGVTNFSICDNDKKKVGISIGNRVIVTPATCVGQYKKGSDSFLIANKNYSQEMHRQLLKMGVDPGDIFIMYA